MRAPIGKCVLMCTKHLCSACVKMFLRKCSDHVLCPTYESEVRAYFLLWREIKWENRGLPLIANSHLEDKNFPVSTPPRCLWRLIKFPIPWLGALISFLSHFSSSIKMRVHQRALSESGNCWAAQDVLEMCGWCKSFRKFYIRTFSVLLKKFMTNWFKLMQL